MAITTYIPEGKDEKNVLRYVAEFNKFTEARHLLALIESHILLLKPTK